MWYFDTAERLSALKEELKAAQADLEAVKTDLKDVEQQSTSSEFLTAKKNLARAA
jgi:hypothetical protein